MDDSMMTDQLAGASLFTAHGEPVRVGSARPFALTGGDAWLVTAGYLDVFIVPVGEADGAGARTHLLRLAPGEPCFGLPAEGPVRLLAVGAPDTRLLRLPRARLVAAAGATDGVRPAMAVVERWVTRLGEAMAAEARPRAGAAREVDLVAGAAVALTGGTRARGRDGVLWVRHDSGHSYLLGDEGLPVNGVGYTPVAAATWLEAREPGRLHLLDASGPADVETVFDGLDRLHRLVLAWAAARVARTAARDRDRLARRADADRAALQHACAELAATLDPAVAAPRGAATAGVRPDGQDLRAHEELTWRAAERVGAAAGIEMRCYPRGEGVPAPADPIAAIARASRCRARTVALRGTWWTAEVAPMLGTLAAGEAVPDDGPRPRPVALLPLPDGRLRLVDPFDGRDTIVDEAVAAELEPFATTFYRAFPARALGVADVVRFGFRGSLRDALLVLAMGIAGALLGLVPSVATGRLFNDVIPGAQRDQLVQLAVILFACALATACFNFTRAVALLRIESRMSTSVQAAIWDRLLALPMPFFRPYTAGDLAVRAMGIENIRQVISGATISALFGGVFSLVNFGLMFHYSAPMAWRATLLIAAAVAISTAGSLLQLRHERAAVEVRAKVSGLVLQLLVGIAKLRVAGAETRAFAGWARRFAEQRHLQFRAERIENVVQAVQGAFPVLANLVLFWTALPLLGSAERLGTGDFLAFLSAYGSAQGALLGTCGALLSTLSTIPLYEQARPILATRPEVHEATTDPGQLSGAITLEHVHFRYAPDVPPTLRDVSLQVRPGEFVALVGPSGSGKSTIFRLLLGFEQPESGRVAYDGQDLAGLDVQAVRRQIGVVLQHGQLMAGDIFTNIAGSARVTIDDAWEAARLAGFDEDIRAMPMGMHTILSEGAGTLSGGQRQRLMIARAIVQRPRMLLFDEATSALDNRTQAIVSASLDRLRVTRVVVAHRLSTVVHADRIVVVERGQVVQQGRYEELLAVPGPFADLARRQLA